MKAINRPAATSSQFKTFTALSPFPVTTPFAEARYSPSRHAGYSFPPNIPAQHILLPPGRHVPAPLYRCPYISSDVSRRDAISKRSQWAASKGRPEKDSAAPARLLRAGCVKTHLTLRRLGTHTAQAYLPLLILPECRMDGVCRCPLHFREKIPVFPAAPHGPDFPIRQSPQKHSSCIPVLLSCGLCHRRGLYESRMQGPHRRHRAPSDIDML